MQDGPFRGCFVPQAGWGLLGMLSQEAEWAGVLGKSPLSQEDFKVTLLYGDDSPTQHPQNWTLKHLLAGPTNYPLPSPQPTTSPGDPRPNWGPHNPSVPSALPQLGSVSFATGRNRTAWGAPVPPALCCRGAGVSALPLHPPSLISISGQVGPGLLGGGRGTRRFPLIAKINTLKFLQEAEECGTAGKNCFIICNNTKAGGGSELREARKGRDKGSAVMVEAASEWQWHPCHPGLVRPLSPCPLKYVCL